MNQLAGIDTAIWYMDSKSQPLHISALLKVKPYPKGDLNSQSILEHIRVAVSTSEMLHLAVVDSPIPLAMPYWSKVKVLDFDQHVFVHDLRSSDDARSSLDTAFRLRSMIGEILAEPLRRDIPPWEIHVFDLGDEIQVLSKIHHALLDGAGGFSLLSSLMDQQGSDTLAIQSFTGESKEIASNSGSKPNLLRALLDLPQEAVTRLESASAFQDTLSQLVTTVAQGKEGSLPEVLNFGAPKLPFSGALRSTRDAYAFSVETSRLRKVARYSQSTLNDVVLAVTSLALERYLKEIYAFELTSSPVVLMPISTRRGGNILAHNQVAGQLVALPYGTESLSETLLAVKEEAWRAKRLHSRFGPKILESFASSIASPLLSPFMRLIGDAKIFDRLDPVFNLIVSNISGTTDELYIEGNLVESVIPFGPLAEGAPLNITFVSYLDLTHFGVASCPDLVKYPDRLGEIFCEVLDKFHDEHLGRSD